MCHPGNVFYVGSSSGPWFDRIINISVGARARVMLVNDFNLGSAWTLGLMVLPFCTVNRSP